MQDLDLQTSISEAGWTSFGSPVILGLHLAQTQNKMCQVLPLGSGDYLPSRQIDGGGPDAAQ